jgi:hypothetical protein
LSIDLLAFVAFEETFHGRVIVAVAFAAHALPIVTLTQSLAIRLCHCAGSDPLQGCVARSLD